MIRATIAATRLPVMIAGALGLAAAAAAPAQAQQVPIQGWYKTCNKQEEVDVCQVQNIVLANSGQLVVGANFIEVKGKINRKVFQVTVPSGRMVPPGIAVAVDGGKPQKLEYVVCMPETCIAEAPTTDALVNSFKRGTEVMLTAVSIQNQANAIKLPLSGFTAAFDGAPLQQSDLEARQRALQEFVKKNDEDFARKLKEEQEKAKQAN